MILEKIGDSMPGLGIVTAVLGIIITMQAIGGPAEADRPQSGSRARGHLPGHLHILWLVQPMATNIDIANDDASKVFRAIKAALIAFAKGFNPIVCVESARRVIVP